MATYNLLISEKRLEFLFDWYLSQFLCIIVDNVIAFRIVLIENISQWVLKNIGTNIIYI